MWSTKEKWLLLPVVWFSISISILHGIVGRKSPNGGFIRNHTLEGNTLYGIEIMVDPQFRGLRLARRLYDARKNLARRYNLMCIIIGGRIPGYAKYAQQMNAREYVDRVINKTLIDPVLTTQVSNGFVLKRLIPNYLTSDAESVGYATFLEWTNLDYVPDRNQSYARIAPVRISRFSIKCVSSMALRHSLNIVSILLTSPLIITAILLFSRKCLRVNSSRFFLGTSCKSNAKTFAVHASIS